MSKSGLSLNIPHDKAPTANLVSSEVSQAAPEVDARLLWQCHRGMLELDVILHNFVKQRYTKLNRQQAEDFQQLLAQPDPLLLTWLLGHVTPQEARMQALVSMIRATPMQLTT